MSGSARSCGKRRIEDLTIAVLVRSESTADIRDTVSETGVNPEKVFFFNTSKKLLEYAATAPCDVALIAAEKLSAKFLDRLCKIIPGVAVASIGAAETLGFRQVIDRGHRFKILNADNLGAALSDFLSSLCQRRRQKRLARGNLGTAVITKGDKSVRSRVVDISTRGIGIEVVDASIFSELGPGETVKVSELESDYGVYARDILAVPKSHYYNKDVNSGDIKVRVGLSIVSAKGNRVLKTSTIDDALRVKSLINKGRSFSLRTTLSGSARSMNFQRAERGDYFRLSLGAGHTSSTLKKNQAVTISFECMGSQHSFLASIDHVDDHHWTFHYPNHLTVMNSRARSRVQVRDREIIATFRHPITADKVSMRVSDLSSAGVLLVDSDGSLDIPQGTLVGPLNFLVNDILFFTVTLAQICSLESDRDGIVYCGVVFNSISDTDSERLLQQIVLRQFPSLTFPENGSAEKIWDFFFDSSFIYREKEEKITPNILTIKRNMFPLIESPENSILTTFIASDDSQQIKGHVAAARIYSKTWLMQHLASLNLEAKNVHSCRDVSMGLIYYLEQQANATWLRSYFQPKKSFPNRMAGGFARQHASPETCTLIEYLYIFARVKNQNALVSFADLKNIRQATKKDFQLISSYHRNNGTYIEWFAEDGFFDEMSLNTVSDLFFRSGLRRERTIYVYELDSSVVGYVAIESTSLGVNLSEVTNRCTLHCWHCEDIVVPSLVKKTFQWHRERGIETCIFFAKPELRDVLRKVDFHSDRTYASCTIHRSLFSTYIDYVRTALTMRPNTSNTMLLESTSRYLQ